MSFQEKLFILKKNRFKERHLIVTAFGETKGKISLFVPAGACSKRFRGLLERFHLVKALLIKKNTQRRWYTLSEARSVYVFDQVAKTYETLTLAHFFSEMVLKKTQEEAPMRHFFLLLTQAYLALEQFSLETDSLQMRGGEVFLIFLAKFLQIQGLHPSLWNCSCCQQRFQEGESVFFKNGFSFCSKHEGKNHSKDFVEIHEVGEGRKERKEISFGALKFWRTMIQHPLRKALVHLGEFSEEGFKEIFYQLSMIYETQDFLGSLEQFSSFQAMKKQFHLSL